MSHSVDIECGLHSQEGIIRGLIRMGFNRSMIHVFDHPIELHKHYAHEAVRQGHIVVRKHDLSSVLGSQAYNDIGFLRNGDGTYKAAVEIKHGFQDKHLRQLVIFHNVEVAKMALDAEGREYEETRDEKGRIQLRAKFKVAARQPNKISLRG